MNEFSLKCTLQMKMPTKIIDSYHYLNMVHGKSAEANISTSADCSDNIREAKRKFSLCGRVEHPELRGGKLKVHERLCQSFHFQINELC